jgi:molecular chaperone DnaK
MAPDNKSLGRFILDGIPPAPRGIPQIEVTFDLDASGILNVTAKDKATGKEQSIKITGSTGLSKDEIEKMQKEAEAHAAEDTRKKEQIEVRNTADNLVYTAEKTLKDAGDKVKSEDKEKVEAEIKNVREVLGKSDVSKEEIEEAAKKLSEELQKVGAAMYSAQGGSAQGQQQQTTEEEKKSSSAEASDSRRPEPMASDEDKEEKAKGSEPAEGAEEGEVVN